MVYRSALLVGRLLVYTPLQHIGSFVLLYKMILYGAAQYNGIASATPVNTLSLEPLLFSPGSFNLFDGKNGGKKECLMCRHQSLRHRVRHHVIERSQQSRHCLHDDCRPEGEDSAGDSAEELGEFIEAWGMSDAQLEEQLQDPLYLLLVRHAIFCRQIENLLKRTADQPQTQHRTMRHPPVPVYRSSRPTGISAG